jgi:hypothetical protein
MLWIAVQSRVYGLGKSPYRQIHVIFRGNKIGWWSQ